MDKSGDSDADGSISWEDFFGSSSDLVPTLLTMYDTLIAEAHDQIQNPNGGETQSQISVESPPFNYCDSSNTMPTMTSSQEGNSNLLRMNSSNNATVVAAPTLATTLEPKAAISADSFKSTIANESNAQVKSVVVLPKNDSSSIIASSQHQQYKFGLLSRSFSRWSSRITDKSSNRTPLESSKSKLNQTKLGALQRPLSVNSAASSTSTSSGSSESSTSLSNNMALEQKAPKASPEDDDDLLRNLSDEEDSTSRNSSGASAKEIASDGNISDNERCFSTTSTGKDGVDSGRPRMSYPPTAQRKQKLFDPNLSYMDRVVMEIVETERVYVTDLHEIISGYLGHWKSSAENEKPLELDDIGELFSNIEEIHAFNSEFVTRVEGCGLDPVQVAKCFVSQKEGFSVYTEYCTHYPRTMFILTNTMRQEQSAKYFRERQASLGHSLPLGSYLLKPVQRILKYHLLLQNIVKHYDGDEDGYTAIVEALSAMTNIAHHINDMKRRHEHAVRVQEIQSLLYGWQGEDLTTYGELCAEGTFRVYGAKALRHVFLFDKMLLITKKKEDGILGFKSHIMCSNLMLIESVPGELLSFHVIPFDNPRLQCTLQAKNSEQKREWTLQLKRVILENYHAVIPIHARQLVMELGQCRPEDGSFLSEKVQTKRQHSAPEYLEKRKQEKDRRKAESTLKAKLRRTRKNGPIISKEVLSVGRRNNRRSSMDSHISMSLEQRERQEREETFGNGMNREMSVSSCPAGITEKPLVKKLSGWRRKSEPGFYLNGIKGSSGRSNGGLISPAPENTHFTIDSAESIDEEIGGEEVDDTPSSPNLEERRESVEEIVGQLVMQNREFQRILSKQRLVHLRKSLAQHQQRRLQEGDESGSDAETEDSVSIPSKNLLEKDLSQASSSSNGIGSSSDMNEDSREDIYAESKDGDLVLSSKNVQRTVSDPGNKSRRLNGPFSHYDPFSLLWSSFRRNDSSRRANLPSNNKETESNESKTANGKPAIRHTHSFTCSTKEQQRHRSPTESKLSESSLPHGDSGVFPNSFTSDSSSSSSEANIPTLPAVWLKQQGEHLATPSTKSGSLPRSFQVGQHQPPSPISKNNNKDAVKSRQRDNGKYPIPDRPFTIASDKPSPSDMSYGEMEQYMSKFNDQLSRSNLIVASEDIDELTTTELTPITSLENLSLHPDHKIYHRSAKTSIKDILLSVTHRLAGIKANRMKGAQLSTTMPSGTKSPINFGSYPNISSPPSNGTLDKSDDIKLKNGSSSLFLRQNYHKKSMKQKLTPEVDSDSENCESIISSGFESLASSGSSTKHLNCNKVGARLAHCSESSYYALSRILSSTFDESRRTQSVVPGISSSSADGERVEHQEGQVQYTGVLLRKNSGRNIVNPDLFLSYIDQDIGEMDGGLSDCDSADGFYEKSFEAIENFLESELFPDSAIFSDQDCLATSSSSLKSASPCSKGSWRISEDSVDNGMTLDDRRKSLQLSMNTRMSESSTRSRIVCSQAILEKLKHLEQCANFQRECLPSPSFDGIKSIQQRRKELEMWKSGLGNREDESETSSQHSTSTINTVIELSPSKSTSFPSSRRCSDTESSGGNSPLTERMSRSSGRSQSQGHLSMIGGGSDAMSKGWVKLVVGKLQGEGDSC